MRRKKEVVLPVNILKPKTSFEDITVGKILIMPGLAKNEYKILAVNKKDVTLSRLKDNQESTMTTDTLLKILR